MMGVGLEPADKKCRGGLLVMYIKATVTRDWARLKVVSKDSSQVVDIAGARFQSCQCPF